MLNVDGWTDGRTYERMNVRTDERMNGRKLAHLGLPAKAGATKSRQFRVVAFIRDKLIQKFLHYYTSSQKYSPWIKSYRVNMTNVLNIMQTKLPKSNK